MRTATAPTNIASASVNLIQGPKGIGPNEVLVVMPTLNEADHIAACLQSLMQPIRWMSDTKIVVVDGGSTDGTQDMVRELQTKYRNLTLIDNPEKIQSAGINLAVRNCANSDHAILVRCDVHAVYPPGYVKNLAQKLHDIDCASVVTPIDSMGSGAFQKAAAWIVETPLGSGGSAHRGGAISGFVDHGHHAAFRLKEFTDIGGYDVSFSHNEDAEFDVRLARAGGRIWLAGDIRVGYLMRPTFFGLWKQYWYYGRGRANTIIKHRMLPRLRQLIPVANILLLAASLLATAITPAGFIWPVIYLIALLAVSIMGTIALRGVNGFWAGPALAAMHVAWGLGFCRRLALRFPRIRSAG